MIKFDTDVAVRDNLSRMIEYFPKVASYAMQQTGRSLIRAIKKGITNKVKVKESDLSPLIRITDKSKSNSVEPGFNIRIFGNEKSALHAGKFKMKKPKRSRKKYPPGGAVRVSVFRNGNDLSFPGAFIATMPSGLKSAFYHDKAKRYKYKVKTGESAGRVVSTPKIKRKVYGLYLVSYLNREENILVNSTTESLKQFPEIFINKLQQFGHI